MTSNLDSAHSALDAGNLTQAMDFLDSAYPEPPEARASPQRLDELAAIAGTIAAQATGRLQRRAEKYVSRLEEERPKLEERWGRLSRENRKVAGATAEADPAQSLTLGDDTPAGPSGWYLDERDSTRETLRWWSGSFWTEKTRPLEAGEDAPVRIGTRRSLIAQRAEKHEQLQAEAAADRARERLQTINESRRSRDGSATRVFEYAVSVLDAEDAEARLNEAGSLGWELVSVHPSGEQFRVFLKREVWTKLSSDGKMLAAAPGAQAISGKAAGSGGGGFFAAGYFESGPDLDADGYVDGGLFDSLGDLFG